MDVPHEATVLMTVGERSRAREMVRWTPIAVAGLVAVLDQATKAVVVATLGPERTSHRWELADPVLSLRYVENRGAAFGILRGQGLVLSLLALVVLGGLVVYYRQAAARSAWLAVGVGMVGGGAVGNLVDRARLGYVVDFVAVGTWPKFNVADSAITIGVAMLAWRVLTADQPRPAARSGARDAASPPAPTLPADG